MHQSREIILTALRYMLSNLGDVNEAVDGAFTEKEVESLHAAHQRSTEDPIQTNFNPDLTELLVRAAVHILSDAVGDVLVVKFDVEVGVYLVASILGEGHDADESVVDGRVVFTPRPAGTVEYQVSDGLPEARSVSHDFYGLHEALACFNEVIAAGSWKAYLTV